MKRPITSLNELQSIELEIMKKVHLFCEENNITYYLAAGTLLGAVRHNGFIPWDDDIDLLMTRNDYELFLRLFPSFAKRNNLTMANNRTQKYYGRPMTKVIDTRTTLVEPEFRHDDEIGVFVDIWAMDVVPEGSSGKKWLKKMRKRKKVLFACNYRFNKKFGFAKNIALFFGHFINSKKYVDFFERQSLKFNNIESNFLMCYLSLSQKCECYEKEWFSSKVLLKFEDCEFWAPVGYKQWLTLVYGDYMQLPPKEKQIPHHVVETYWIE